MMPWSLDLLLLESVIDKIVCWFCMLAHFAKFLSGMYIILTLDWDPRYFQRNEVDGLNFNRTLNIICYKSASAPLNTLQLLHITYNLPCTWEQKLLGLHAFSPTHVSVRLIRTFGRYSHPSLLAFVHMIICTYDQEGQHHYNYWEY